MNDITFENSKSSQSRAERAQNGDFTGKLTSRAVSGRHLRSPAPAASWSTIDHITYAGDPRLRDIE